MLEPIVLTKYGETLKPYPGSEKEDVAKKVIGLTAGVHDICNGWVDKQEISKDHWVLLCRCCHLRVVIPKAVETWEDLQVYMKAKLFQDQASRFASLF